MKRLLPLVLLLLAAPAVAQWGPVAWGDVGVGGGGTTSPLTTKGDLWGYSTTDARLGIGTNNFCLVADSTQALGVKWAACPGVTNSAGANVLTKSDGTNLVASSVTDDGTLVTINTRTTARTTILTDGTGPALGVTATLPASPSAAVSGISATITGAGTAAQAQNGMSLTFAAGYTGGTSNRGLFVTNATVGSGTGVNSTMGVMGYLTGAATEGNALYGYAAGAGAYSVGASGIAAQGTRKIGVFGGILANNTGQYGGFFTLTGTLPSDALFAALAADNNAVAWPIIQGRDNGTVVFQVNDGGGVDLKREVEANTAGSGTPNALIATESWKVLTNEGATAANYHTLPTAAVGLTFTFVVQDADGVRVVAGADDTIRVIDKVTAAAGYVESTTIGSVVTVVAINAVEWIGTTIHGVWTDGTFTYDDTGLTAP